MQRNITPFSHPFHVLKLNSRILVISILCLISLPALRAFSIECPPDVTVHCTDEIWDLSIYGTATIYGYGDPQSAGPPTSVHYSLNNCNVGHILRTWVAYDYAGYPHTCSQKITVTGAGGYVQISWPPDYTIHACYPATQPDDLPPPYDRPVIHGGGGGCSQILYSFSDKVFNINPPACKKILRTWTVIDWCSYDPHAYYPVGIWEYVQIIKITPANPPQIWCPADTVVSAGADCTGGHVSLPPAFGISDCGATVKITNNSPYAYHNGADASGNYPIGTTKVTFWADDGCGQKVSCSMYITVKDMKKPTPICYYGVSLTLMQMPDGYYLDLRPQFFNKGSFDNCTPKHKLEMWVEPSRVGCDELGETAVRMYVRDESGNVEYCNTIVYVQDNLGICPPKDGLVDGTVHTLTGELISDVKVTLEGSTAFSMTDSEGYYAFPSLRFGKPYTVMPTRDIDDLSGVNTLDMAILLRHIMGTERMTSPYHLIAADIDRSGRVAVNDLLSLRDLILMDLYGLEPTTSWRFIDAGYTFENPLDPFNESFPESYTIQNLESTMNGLDFVAIKLGDLNGDVTDQGMTQQIVARSSGIPVWTTDRSFTGGEVFDINLAIGQHAELSAFQLAILADLSFLEVLADAPMQDATGLDVMTSPAVPGTVSILWYGLEPLSKPQIAQLKVRALRDGSLSEAVRMSPDTRSVGYCKGSDEAVQVQLHFDVTGEGLLDLTHADQEILTIGQNYPNPFSGLTYIPVQLKEDAEIQIDLFDVTGRKLWSTVYPGQQGYQEIEMHTELPGTDGVLICRLTSGNDSATLRMLAAPRN